MSNTAKEIVKSFYETDVVNNLSEIDSYLHNQVELYWNSSFGYSKKNKEEILTMFEGISKSFESFRCEASHYIAEGDTVTVRYTYLGKTIEEPDTEVALAHFMIIWELRDQKLYKGFQISQQGETTKEGLESFLSK